MRHSTNHQSRGDQTMRSSTTLRRMLEGPEIVVLPGAYDALSARLAERAGFAAMFTTGFGFSAAALGQPDFGLLTMSETMDRVRHIVSAVSVPVVADMDTG
jgi:2-methylisocitrate lyase-like PEP mutase family enzyme